MYKKVISFNLNNLFSRFSTEKNTKMKKFISLLLNPQKKPEILKSIYNSLPESDKEFINETFFITATGMNFKSYAEQLDNIPRSNKKLSDSGLYLLNANPTLDTTFDLDKLSFIGMQSSGKGANIATILLNSNLNPKALFGFYAGHMGSLLQKMLINRGIENLISIGPNNTNNTRMSIHFEGINMSNSLVTKGAEIDDVIGDELIKKMITQAKNDIKHLGSNKKIVFAMSGSLPPGLSKSFYKKAIIALNEFPEVRVILDTKGDALKYGIEGKPFMVKINKHELNELISSQQEEIDLNLSDKIIMDQFKKMFPGIEYIVISNEDKDIIGFNQNNNNLYRISPPNIDQIDPIGAGDSMATIIAMKIKSSNFNFEETLQISAVAGARTASLPGGQFCGIEDLLK